MGIRAFFRGLPVIVNSCSVGKHDVYDRWDFFSTVPNEGYIQLPHPTVGYLLGYGFCKHCTAILVDWYDKTFWFPDWDAVKEYLKTMPQGYRIDWERVHYQKG